MKFRISDMISSTGIQVVLVWNGYYFLIKTHSNLIML